MTDSGQEGCARSPSEEPSQSEHTEFVGGIPPDYDITDGAEVLIVSRDQSYLTHGIHKFPAKFFPELPRYLILRFSESGNIVLDPMCGSGTAVLEAAINGRVGVGVDIDSMARMITAAKTTAIHPDVLDSSSGILVQEIRQRMAAVDDTPDIPDFPYRDKWFQNHVLHELAVIRDSIDLLPEALPGIDSEYWPDLLRFFRVLMSSIIRGVSNADPHCTRTVIRKNLAKNVKPGDTVRAFFDALSRQTDGMKELWSKHVSLEGWEVQVLDADATNTGIADESVDLSVTSPPYINAVDYTRTHQLEMFWLGHLGEGPLSEVKRDYIGTETVYKREYSTLRVSGLCTLDPLLESIYVLDPRRSFIVFKFFKDMEAQLRETYRVLKPGGHYCVAIGNNLIRGVRVKSHEVLTEIAEERVGFEIDRVFFSKLIRHFIRIPRKERMLGEWVIILRKPKR